MGAINLLHDAFDALWAVIASHDISHEALLGLKQKVQGLLMEYDSSANPLGHYGTHGIERNRDRLQTAVQGLYGEDEGTAELPLLELMFSTPDTPEYTATTEVLVRYIAVRDELTSDSDSSDSDSSDSD